MVAGSADGFQDMIRATRERCAASKAARDAAEQKTAMAAPGDSDDIHDAGHAVSAVASARCPSPRTQAKSATEAAYQLTDGAENDPDDGCEAQLPEGSVGAAAQNCISPTAAGPSPATRYRIEDNCDAYEQCVVCSQLQLGADTLDDQASPPFPLSPSL